MPPRTENTAMTLHHDVYPGIDINTRLKDAATGKVVYITGASRGIGASTAHAYAKAGCKALFITARSVSALESVAASVQAAVPSVIIETYPLDVTDVKAVGQSVKKCVETFGKVDIMIANAGYMECWQKIGEIDPEEWWTTWNINIRGTFNVIHHSIKHLVESRGYAILLSSVGAQLKNPGASAYTTTKHAVNRLAEFIQIEYGSEGVKVFAIHPGGILTDLGLKAPSIVPLLIDKVEIASHSMVRLTSGSEDWLSGRYVNCRWDLDELAKRRKEIEDGDLLKNRLDIGSLAEPFQP